MKQMLFGLLCFFSFELGALDYESQFENDHVSVAKVTLCPYEKIASHRDSYPQVVIALKGGTVTRIEADGREVEVAFPTGEAVLRNPDPEGEFHSSFNNSSEPMELVIIQFKGGARIEKEKSQMSVPPGAERSKLCS